MVIMIMMVLIFTCFCGHKFGNVDNFTINQVEQRVESSSTSNIVTLNSIPILNDYGDSLEYSSRYERNNILLNRSVVVKPFVNQYGDPDSLSDQGNYSTIRHPHPPIQETHQFGK